jgi:hypothetical protein
VVAHWDPHPRPIVVRKDVMGPRRHPGGGTRSPL